MPDEAPAADVDDAPFESLYDFEVTVGVVTFPDPSITNAGLTTEAAVVTSYTKEAGFPFYSALFVPDYG